VNTLAWNLLDFYIIVDKLYVTDHITSEFYIIMHVYKNNFVSHEEQGSSLS